MPLKDPIKRLEYERNRYASRREYWKQYQRDHKKEYISSGSSLGYLGEEEGLGLLSGSRRKFRPSDLEYEGKLIEVKTAIKQLSHTSTKAFVWKFYLKQLRQVDKFLIICKDFDKSTKYIFLIPDKDLKIKNLAISANKIKKYSQYLLSSH